MKTKNTIKGIQKLSALFFLLLTAVLANEANAQVIFDGVNCNASPSAHGTSDEWGTAMASDVDNVNPGSADIEYFWASQDVDYVYFAFSRRGGGNGGFTFYANTDCDITSGDTSFGGADFAMHFSIQTGVIQDDTVYQWDPSTGVTGEFISTNITFAGLIGGTSCTDSTDDKFFELRFPISDLFDVCNPTCDEFNIEVGTTNAGGSFKSAIKDGFVVNIPVFINQPPKSIASGPSSACEGVEITLSAASSLDNTTTANPKDSIVSYEWDFSYDGVTFNAEGNGVTVDTSFGAGARTVALRVEDVFGCLDTLTDFDLTINENPKVSMTQSVDRTGVNRCKNYVWTYAATIDAIVTGTPPYSYVWTVPTSTGYTDINSPGTASTDTLHHTYPFCLWANPTKTVSVMATDANGCVADVATPPVPVDLVYFKGEINNGDAILKWQTASEINSEYFVIEKSYDGNLYAQVGMVEAAGNSTELLDYSMIDQNMGEGDVYYRLSQYDFDGSMEVFAPIVLSSDMDFGGIKISPNPSEGLIEIELPSTTAESELTVLDINGKELFKMSVGVNANVTQQALDITSLPKGLYYVKYGNSRDGYTSKIVQHL
ncbi:MAG: T9SS type A sorting domain-containing protein [Bacteroidia bacterium]